MKANFKLISLTIINLKIRKNEKKKFKKSVT